jgi:YesN/AraC family two-component response regulator
MKNLLEFSKPLNVLYVEDDLTIRANYAKVFTDLFASVDLAQDGEEGLEKFLNNTYDIIITDISMPRMNGIEMIENILNKSPEQIIIVTSAHDDSAYLLKLIELGIEKFLIKPINFKMMTLVLFRTCKRIFEMKELKEYQNHLEDDNLSYSRLIQELKEKNIELEQTIHQLTRKENVNITLVDGIEKEKDFSTHELDFYSPEIETISAKEFIESYAGNIDSLNDNLESVEETLELLIHQKLTEPSQENLQQISDAFLNYGQHLSALHKFSHLAESLHNFGSALSQVEDLSLLKEMKGFLFGIADSLQKWRNDVLLERTATDIHFLDSSIISDCMQTESMLSNSHHEGEDDLDNLFF